MSIQFMTGLTIENPRQLLALLTVVSISCISSGVSLGAKAAEEVDTIRTLIGNGQANEALRRLDAVNSSTFPSTAEYFFLKARSLQELKKNVDALIAYTLSISSAPTVKAYVNRALVRGALQDLSGALEDLNYSIRLDPLNPESYLNRGVTMAGLNRPVDAINDLDAAIRLRKIYPEAYRNRGIIYSMTGKKQEACRDWRLARSFGDIDASYWIYDQCSPTSSRERRTN